MSFFKKKDEINEVPCKCGHDIMLHGFSNMGCSVMVQDVSGEQKKCSCQKFQKS